MKCKITVNKGLDRIHYHYKYALKDASNAFRFETNILQFPSNNFVFLIAIVVGLYPLRHLPPDDARHRHFVMLDLLSRYKKI